MLLSPSILSADFGNLQSQIEILNNSDADYIHIDIMDGIFVPNISFGFSITKYIAQYSKKPLDFHLMIQNPTDYLEKCIEHKASIITVHYENAIHLHRLVMKIKSLGAKVGVALNPHTPVENLKNILHELDLVLIMSVNPGFGAQQFIPQTYEKIKVLKKMTLDKNPNLLIQIDGGVSLENFEKLKKCGANFLVAGNSIFKDTQKIEDQIKKFKK